MKKKKVSDFERRVPSNTVFEPENILPENQEIGEKIRGRSWKESTEGLVCKYVEFWGQLTEYNKSLGHILKFAFVYQDVLTVIHVKVDIAHLT